MSESVSSTTESSREMSPETRKYRSLSPFFTPDKRLDVRKYNQFLNKCDVLELHYYQNSFNMMSVKYPKNITKEAQKQIRKTKIKKWFIYLLIICITILLCYEITTI